MLQLVLAAEARRKGGKKPVYAYCLFCLTQRCATIARLLEIRGADRAFSPQIIRKQRKQGENIRRRFDFLPGYVFLFSEEKLADYALFSGIDGVIRRVGDRENGYELQGEDREFALELLEKDGVVGAMKISGGVGDQVVLEDPLFRDYRGRVTRIERRKERAKVEFVFENTKREIWVSLENMNRLPAGEQEGKACRP